jgi:hypothetical protein
VTLHPRPSRLLSQPLRFTSSRTPGFKHFSQLRLAPLLQRLPARFDTIPSRPSSRALANTSAPSVVSPARLGAAWGASAERRGADGRRVAVA